MQSVHELAAFHERLWVRLEADILTEHELVDIGMVLLLFTRWLEYAVDGVMGGAGVTGEEAARIERQIGVMKRALAGVHGDVARAERDAMHAKVRLALFAAGEALLALEG